MAQPYNKLKVPNSISHVSVDDIKSAQQSDASLAKIGEQVKSEAILVNGRYGCAMFLVCNLLTTSNS
jgi:hypothetical protein